MTDEQGGEVKVIYQYNEKTGQTYRLIENKLRFLQISWHDCWKTIHQVSDREYETSYRSEAEAWQRGERA